MSDPKTGFLSATATRLFAGLLCFLAWAAAATFVLSVITNGMSIAQALEHAGGFVLIGPDGKRTDMALQLAMAYVPTLVFALLCLVSTMMAGIAFAPMAVGGQTTGSLGKLLRWAGALGLLAALVAFADLFAPKIELRDEVGALADMSIFANIDGLPSPPVLVTILVAGVAACAFLFGRAIKDQDAMRTELEHML